MVRALAPRVPTFFRVRLAPLVSPGFFTVSVKMLSQAALTLVSVVTPAPVDKQALPAATLFDSTSVPVANLLVGLVVSAVKEATVAAAVKPHRAVTTAAVRTTLAFMAWEVPFRLV